MARCDSCIHCEYAEDENCDLYLYCGIGIDEPSEDCSKYKKIKSKLYIEKYTSCDACEDLESCIENGLVINVSTSADINNHYVKGCGTFCNK